MDNEGQIKYFLQCGKVDVALSFITPTIAKKGLVRGRDILAEFCIVCESDEKAFRVANVLIQMGYKYLFRCASAYAELAIAKRWKLMHFLLDVSGAYHDSHLLWVLFYTLDRKQIEPWFERNVTICKFDLHERQFAKYERWRIAREKARTASIALIGVGKRRRCLDVCRVISRVAWALRAQAECMIEENSLY